MEQIKIERVIQADQKMHTRVKDLLADLYPNHKSFSFERFAEVVENGQVRIFVAKLGEEIVGTGSLAFYRKLCGDIWIVEDVDVDTNKRGYGIGRKLIEVMLEEAKKHGAEVVDLTTRSGDARKFYMEKCGFKDKAEGRPFWGLRYTF